MRVAIVGSREFSDLKRVRKFVANLAKKYPDAIVVSGGARGVDKHAERTALDFGLGLISYRVAEAAQDDVQGFTIEVVTEGEAAEAYVKDKNRRGTCPWFQIFAPAAFCRNVWVVQDADPVVAFWDGSSRGTKFVIDTAQTYGRDLHVYREDE